MRKEATDSSDKLLNLDMQKLTGYCHEKLIRFFSMNTMERKKERRKGNQRSA